MWCSWRCRPFSRSHQHARPPPPPQTKQTKKQSTCRHGDRCSRLHNKPTVSQTIILHNMYQNPVLSAPIGADGLPMPVDPDELQDHYEVRVLCSCVCFVCVVCVAWVWKRRRR